MILTDKAIEQAISEKALVIDPFLAKQIQPASYDLRVGNQGLATSSSGVVNIKEKGFFELRPGDFAILLTREVIEFDSSHVARIGLRSRYARKGVIATTGPQVDPGFRGRLKIGVTNLSPHTVTFPYEDDFITLEIHQLTEPAQKPYTGPYQGLVDLTPDDIAAVSEGDNIGFAKMLDSMRSLSANVSELSESVKKFTSQNDLIQRQYSQILWVVGAGLAFVGLLVIFK